MNPFPKHTDCGECNHRIKLKRALWEVWTDGSNPVGAFQQRECAHCHSIVLAAIGDLEFIATLSRHFGGEQRTH